MRVGASCWLDSSNSTTTSSMGSLAHTKESDRSKLALCGRPWIRMRTVEAVRPVSGIKESQTQPELPGRASYIICGAKYEMKMQGHLLKK